MPELPEVETFCQFLLPKLKNKSIKEVEVYWKKLIKKPQNKAIFREKLLNEKFLTIKRRGKYILFFLQKYVLVVHLRMEGRFFFAKAGELNPEPANCLCKFFLSEGSCLYYVDSRHFGTFHLEKKQNYFNNSGLKKLGVEPFSDQLDEEYLLKHWQKRKINVKSALLEQTVIVGIGNIYACEILFLSKIWPYKKVNELSKKELKTIIENCQKIMKEAIKLKGTTIHTFSVDNKKGLYFNELKVYGRAQKPCFICNLSISKEKINGRGTFYCPSCQKK